MDRLFNNLQHLDLFTFLYVLIIMLVYFVAKRLTVEQIKKLLVRNVDLKHSLFRQINNDTCINTILDKLLVDLHGDRIYIFQYHNGGSNIVGIPFLRCTNTHERCQLGIEPHINLYQNLPLAMYGFRHELIAQGMMITISDLELIKESDKSSYNLMRSQNIKSLYIKGLFSLDNTPIGFIGLDYIHDQKELTSHQIKEFELGVQKISGCLEGSHE